MDRLQVTKDEQVVYQAGYEKDTGYYYSETLISLSDEDWARIEFECHREVLLDHMLKKMRKKQKSQLSNIDAQ